MRFCWPGADTCPRFAGRSRWSDNEPNSASSRPESEVSVITGVHAILFSKEADAVRAFFRDVLECPSVDAGEGWLIFGLPPAELAVHPDEGERHEVYLMCDDIESAVDELNVKGVATGPIQDEGWGLLATVTIAGEHQIGLYQPRHPTALDL